MAKKRGNWSEESMKMAMDKVISKEMTVRGASERYGVPKSTLGDRVKALVDGKEATAKPCCSDNKGTFSRTFNPEQEEILYNHVKALDTQLMPLNKPEFLKLAYKLAEKLKINHRFNKEKGMAGKDFYYDFMKHHPDLSLRTAESTSLQRAVGFSEKKVNIFFDKLSELMEKYKFTPSRIYNADETGVSCVHTNRLKVMSVKGKKQVGKLTSGERGRNVTVLLTINTAGDQFIPPLFVFPRMRIDNDLKKDAPPGSTFDGQMSGWITKDGFLKWMQAFVERVNPTEKSPVLLIIDGHSSHKDLDVIIYAKENHVHMISLPPHTSHKIQPLDRCIMKPFKNAYNEACGLWMRKYPNMKITLKDIAGLVNSAFSKICRMELAQNGFECTGIYPLDRNVFSDLDFAGSRISSTCEAKERPKGPGETTENPDQEEVHQPADVSSLTDMGGATSSNHVAQNPMPNQPSVAGPSHAFNLPVSPNETCRHHQEGATLILTETQQLLAEISPLPSTSSVKYKIREDRSEKSEILTSTSYKNQLVEKKVLREEKKAKTEQRIKLREMKQKIKEEKLTSNADKQKRGKLSEKRKLASNTTKLAPRKRLKVGSCSIPASSSSTTPSSSACSTSTSEKTNCIICGESFEEDWIQCNTCKGWAHENCADLEDSLFYHCDVCKNNK